MPARRGPGPVAAAHRLLIAAALVCGLVYAAWEFGEYRRTGDAGALGLGLLAVAVSGVVALYLRSLRALGAKLTPRNEKESAGRR